MPSARWMPRPSAATSRSNLVSTASGRLDFDSFSGSLDTDRPMTYPTGNKRHVSGDIGSGGGSNAFHFKTFSGDVRIK